MQTRFVWAILGGLSGLGGLMLVGCEQAKGGEHTAKQAAVASTNAAALAGAAPAAPPATAPTHAPSEPGSAPSTAAVAQPEGTRFGAGVTLATSTTVKEILATPTAFAGKTLRVEGMIIDVCPKRGCWFELAGDAPGQKLRFKVQDGDMVFPMDAKGKYAVAEGTLAVKELSLEETKQYLEYQAKEYGQPVDPAALQKPMSIVRLDGTGAVLRDQK